MIETGTPAEDRNDKSPAKKAWHTPHFAALEIGETAKGTQIIDLPGISLGPS